MKIKDLLLPTKKNDYTPHLLQKVAMMGMAMLVLLSFFGTNLQALWWQSSDWLVGAVLPATIVDLTNHERSNLSAPVLTRSALLDQAAELKAENMAKNKYFAHFSPDGTSPWYWLDQVGYSYVHAGENLAIYFSDSEAVVKAWMKSPSHRANIIDSNYTEIGIGTAKGVYKGYKTVYVVQLFGTPKVANVNATTSPKISALIKPTELLASVATKPNSVLQSIYLVLGLFVSLLLLVSIFVGVRFHRPRQVFYGIGLLLLMSGLFYLHINLTSDVVLASESWINTEAE